MELDPSALGFSVGVLITALDVAIVAMLIPRIISQRRESGATLAWVFFVVLVPFLGLVAFWILGTTRLRLRRRVRRRVEATVSGKLEVLHLPLMPPSDPPVRPALRTLVRRLDAAGPVDGNEVELYREGEAKFAALEAAIDRAERHVHATYYIWAADGTGRRVLERLVAARRRGVEVRLLLDDVGTRAGPRFFRPLVDAGGQVARFLPVSLFARRMPLNNRNHRKLVVVDGRVGFTGGMNVGDEYLGRRGAWRDAHVRLEGPAVVRLQEVFAQDWFHATHEDLVRPDYFPAPTPLGDTWAQILSSGPDDPRWTAIGTLLFAAITSAQRNVWLETPYFVPDQATLAALVSAALRGVDVRLLLPGESDHPLVLYAGRSFYPELLAAGVAIYELPRGFLHAKTATIDGELSTVGSANLDRRSFRLNFETNAFFFGPSMAERLEASFLAVQRDAVAVDAQRFARRSTRQRFGEAAARVLAPLL